MSRQFDRAMLATTVAGAAGWPAWVLVARIAPAAAQLAGSIMLCAIVMIGVGATWRDRWSISRAALLVAVALVALVFWGSRYPAVALLVAGGILSLAVPAPWRVLPRLNAALALGVSIFLGAYVVGAVAASHTLANVLPPIVHHALTGAAFGFLASFGHLATQARWRRDHVETAFHAEKKRGPMPPLAVQALHVYRRIRDAIPAEDDDGLWNDTRRTVSRLMLQVLALTRQSAEMAEDLALTDRDELDRKRQAMEDAAAGAADAEARRHYRDTAAVLAQRLDRLRQFSQRRERVEALSHHCLSVLENLRLALAQARLSGDATGPAEVSRALERLGALQSELDCTAEALRELEPDIAAAEPTMHQPMSKPVTHPAG